jgi:SET domain
VSSAEVLGVCAAGAQVGAYVLYIRLFLSGKILPNAASWLMFAYGTALLTFLEWRNAATWAELALPVTCALMSIVVAGLCVRKGATDPVDRHEKMVFLTDLTLTIAYTASAVFISQHSKYETAFLLAGNITTVTAFSPLIRSTWSNPAREEPAPWIGWTLAYGLLLAATLSSTGLHHLELLVYPALCVLLHGLIALFSIRRIKNKHLRSATISIQQSAINGNGMYARVAFAAGDKVSELTGCLQVGLAASEPNSIGIERDVWIAPDFPLQFINHSCDPNTAFASERTLVATRAVSVGEELTMDYSTTEVDPQWSMGCSCGSPECRRVLRAIQIDFAEASVAPPANPSMQKVWSEESALHKHANLFHA